LTKTNYSKDDERQVSYSCLCHVLQKLIIITIPATTYKDYYNRISESIARLLKKNNIKRLVVDGKIEYNIESVSEQVVKTYHFSGNNLFELLQNNSIIV